jgi:hypothetical protein
VLAGKEGQDGMEDRIERCMQTGKGRVEKQTWVEMCRQAGKSRKERQRGIEWSRQAP